MIKFNRNNFFPSKEKILNENLSILLGDDVIFNNIHNRFEIEDISSLNNFRENSILFLEKNFTQIINYMIILNKYIVKQIVIYYCISKF